MLRSLQTSSPALFTANYVAQFQHLHDAACLAPAPKVDVFCVGAINVTNTSDPTISCEVSPTPLSDGTSFANCTNSCVDSACDSVYATSTYGDDTYGKIFFTCSGETIADAAGFMLIEDTGPGQCIATSSGTRNFRVASLGVECPTSPGNLDYVFDDRYFECVSASSLNIGGMYTCAKGDTCPESGLACDFPIGQFIVTSQIQWFQDTCITPTVPVTPAPSPGAVAIPTLGVEAQFTASWALTFDATSGNSCSGSNPTISMKCIGSASDINFVNASSPTISCNPVGSNVLECKDSSDTFVNQFANVSYTCSAPSLPLTRVDYPENEAFCDSNPANATIGQNLQLGVRCDENETYAGKVYNLDLFFDCGEVSTQFDYLDEFGTKNGTGQNISCFQTLTIPRGSSKSDIQKVPGLSMETDESWQTTKIIGCYKIVPINPPSSPSASTPEPSPSALATSTPTSHPHLPTGSGPIQATASTNAPVASRGTGVASDVATSKSRNTGAIVGGVAGAVVGICVAGCLIIYLRSRRQNNQGGASFKPPLAVHSTSPPYSDVNGNGNNASAPSETGHTEAHGHGYDDEEEIAVQATVSSNSGRFADKSEHLYGTHSGQIIPQQTNMAFLRAGGPGHEDVDFKDQTRSVAVPGEAEPSVEGVVPAVPVTGGLPHHPGLDTSNISDDRSHVTGNSGRTGHSAEPDGRIAGIEP
jgi:hypothetical protein